MVVVTLDLLTQLLVPHTARREAMSGNLIDVGGGGYSDPQQRPSVSAASLGPEPELINKAEIDRITSPPVKPPRLRSIQDTEFPANDRDEPVIIAQRERLRQLAYGLALALAGTTAAALVVAPGDAFDARALGSMTYAALSMELSFRATYPPRVPARCCHGWGPGANARGWFLSALVFIATGVAVGWTIDYEAHAASFGAGIFVFSFCDAIVLGAEEKRSHMYWGLVVVLLQLVLNTALHYEVGAARGVAFSLLAGLVILVHVPLNILSISGRWASDTADAKPRGHELQPVPAAAGRTIDGLPIRRISQARQDDSGDDADADAVLISHD